MKKVLLVAATEFEIQPIRKRINENQILITGLGVYATIFHLMKKITHQQYDLIIHAGIGGSFDKNYPLGSVFQIVADRFADIGYETPDGKFNDFFGSELISGHDLPFEDGWINNPFKWEHSEIPSAKGITVNTVSGCKESIIQRKKYNAQIESMEGAALFYVCRQFNIKFLSLRAVSNYVTPRNREEWQIQKAIQNLNDTLGLILE